MTKNAAGERTILRYHGNTPAIIKAMPRATVGVAKVMIFALGYGYFSLFRTAEGSTGHRTVTYLTEQSSLP